MRRALVIQLGVFLGALAARLGAQSPVMATDSLQRIVAQRVAAGRTPGIILGVIDPDGTKRTIVAGEARKGIAVDEHTLFEIGSITKAFTGILLADMSLRGEVRLDQPVAELLPAGTRVPSRGGRQITLGDLASQVSGLPRLPDNMRPADPANPYADYGVAQLYDFLARHELRRDPGAQFEYSNLGVGLLGHALALRAGRSYEELVRERILGPLGMTSTVITLTPALRERMAHGHSGDEVVPLWDLPTLAGAGALRSTMRDMLLFLAANLDPPATPLGDAIDLADNARFTVNPSTQLGLNWLIMNFRGDTLVFHNGGTAGFRTIIAWNRRTRAGAVLLGNSSQDNEDIVRHVLMNAPLANVVVRTEVSLPPDRLADYAGRYRFTPQFALEVTLEDGVLYARATDQPKLRIFAEALDRFFYKAVDAQLEFTREGNRVTGVTLHQNGGRVRAQREPH